MREDEDGLALQLKSQTWVFDIMKDMDISNAVVLY
jgi:hypothetical protein